MARYGQLVIGPPGSGKSTYCAGMSQFLQETGRKVSVVNLDPANDQLPYKCDVNISELVTLEDVMEYLRLGPNGGLVYCMELLDKNSECLHTKLSNLSDNYILLDCPGQAQMLQRQVLSRAGAMRGTQMVQKQVLSRAGAMGGTQMVQRQVLSRAGAMRGTQMLQRQVLSRAGARGGT